MTTDYQLSIASGQQIRVVAGRLVHPRGLFLWRFANRICDGSPWKVIARNCATYPALLLNAIESAQTSQN